MIGLRNILKKKTKKALTFSEFLAEKNCSKIIFIKNLNLEVYTMKAFFRKVARIKKRKAIKRAIVGGLAA